MLYGGNGGTLRIPFGKISGTLGNNWGRLGIRGTTTPPLRMRQDIEDDLKFIGRLKELWCVEADLERVGPRRFFWRPFFHGNPKELWLRGGVLEPRLWYICI